MQDIYKHTDRDGDEIRVEVDDYTPEGYVDVVVSSDGYTPLTVYVPREAFAEIAKTVGEPKTLDDVAFEDVVDVEEAARFMAARSILDPTGLGVVSVAEVTLMADLIAKAE